MNTRWLHMIAFLGASDHRKGRDARRDHQLCAVSSTTSWGKIQRSHLFLLLNILRFALEHCGQYCSPGNRNALEDNTSSIAILLEQDSLLDRSVERDNPLAWFESFVQFLSMKLASVNPRFAFDDDHFLAKEVHRRSHEWKEVLSCVFSKGRQLPSHKTCWEKKRMQIPFWDLDFSCFVLAAEFAVIICINCTDVDDDDDGPPWLHHCVVIRASSTTAGAAAAATPRPQSATAGSRNFDERCRCN